ncbi:hypothetical protein ACHHYP_00562 [Achlya hypogyna]|uniref:Peptidase C1A papain C-terminal domain-containing protein n=1 Tax=Achlya hypogyna TaxID=1202772 RepID=A0A1V9ZU48_ACHHY|nr:hypothetical protein ACHHYP_00562 [Achlya hypogyna]
MTRDGFTGGFVVKNSWLDGPTQGSHSLAYWMQEHSDWEERVVCPNSYNPFNWYQCGNDAEPVVAPTNSTAPPTTAPANRAFNRTNAFSGGVQACRSKETLIYADINYQPLHLVCIDPHQCSQAPNTTYFVKNTTDWGDRMTVMCVWEVNAVEQTDRAFCLKPMLEVDIARTLTPVPSEVRANDPDRCGFYFMPYEAIRRYIAQFQGFYVNAFDIEWHPQSYMRHEGEYPHLNYSLLKQSTAFQHRDDFDGPFPFAKVSYQYGPIYGSQEQLPVVRQSRLLNSKHWLTHYGLLLVLVTNVSILVLLGWQIHTSSTLSVRPTPNLSTPIHSGLPTKFGVDYVTPYKNQAGRGTCWDFGTIGVLEQSYRRHGIEQGWLQPHEYVAFSEQAYGVEVASLCTGPKTSPQQKACRVADDNIWRNSTEGGEVPLLYYLQHGLHDAVFPDSICPYFPGMGHDLECPGLDTHRKSNPISFSIMSMGTYYDEATTKQQLVALNTAMPLSTNMVTVTHYYPCIGDWAADPRCDPEVCHICPPELPMTACCIPMAGDSGVTIEGEFVAHSGMAADGGHVMLLVGYNDVFETRDGFTGGFIVKNSWADGRRQGSHSMQYWLQDVSEWEERMVCPNSYNPFNWYMPTEDDGVKDIASCLSQDSTEYAHLNRMPLNLKCVDAFACDPTKVYFAHNWTDYGDRMIVMCFYEYDATTTVSTHMCLPPMLPSHIADTLEYVECRKPVQVYPNDPDQCGFYFIPYEVNRKINAQFQGFFVNSFNITWAPQSYSANAKDFPQYDYSLIESSTKRQHYTSFDGPFPSAHVYKTHKHRHIRRTMLW